MKARRRISLTPGYVKEYDEELVGDRIKIWWHPFIIQVWDYVILWNKIVSIMIVDYIDHQLILCNSFKYTDKSQTTFEMVLMVDFTTNLLLASVYLFS